LIDTHCHLLPGLDDGPRTPHDSLELARSLAGNGVTRVLCTPHYSAMFPTEHDAAAARLAEVALGVEEAGLELEVSLAAEVSPGYAIAAPLEELERRAIGGHFLLVEVLADVAPPFFASALERLAEAGLVPIFGHPERCRALHRRLSLVDAMRRQGAVIQVVAPSLIGRWGADVEATAWRLIDTGRADLLASDAHGSRRRGVHLKRAAELVRERLGDAVATELTVHRPAAVLQGASLGRAP